MIGISGPTFGARSPKKAGLAYGPLASGDYELRTSFQNVPAGNVLMI